MRYLPQIIEKIVFWLRRARVRSDGEKLLKASRDAVARIVEVTVSAASIGGSGLIITTAMQDHFEKVVLLCRFPPSLIFADSHPP